MGNEFGNLAGARRTDLGRNVARRARMTRGVQPDPLPSDSLSQRPMQHDVHSVDSSPGERAVHSASASGQVGIKAIDVGRRDLRDRQVSQVRLQVVLNEALGLPLRARRPIPRGCLKPAIEELGQRSGMSPGVRGFVGEASQFPARRPLASSDGSRCPALPTALRVNPHVDAELPAVRPSSADRSGHDRRLGAMANPWPSHGQTPRIENRKWPLTWSGRRDSNPRPSPWQGDALPTEPRPRRALTLAAEHPGSRSR